MKYPFFSVIIPVYNVENYLSQCIDSVLCQSYQNFEIILVNDGSTDNSADICRKYARQDTRIKYYYKKNGGLSSARNYGFGKALCEYIIYLDSDDYWIDSCLLEDAYKYIIDHREDKIDFILFQAQKFYESSQKIVEDTLYNCNFINSITKDEVVRYLIQSGTYSMSACTKIIRKAFLIDNNVKFEEGLLGEDLDWFMSLVIKAKTIKAISNLCYSYRIRSGSITTTIGEKNLFDTIYILRKWYPEVDNSCPSAFKKYYYGILAYAFVVAILNFHCVRNNRKQVKKELKSLSFLLKYGVNKRIKICFIIYHMFGIEITSYLLSRVYSIKST